MKEIKGRIISLLTVTALIATGTTLNVFAENGMNKINTDTINSGYNVIDKDTDGDGLTDSDELHIGLDPENPKTFGIPDGKYVSKQVISENNNSLSKINKKKSPYKLSAEFESTGYVEGNLNAEKSKYTKVIKNNAILGNAFDLDCEDTCNVNKVVLKFDVSDTYVNDNSNTFKNFSELKGLKKYVIFKYFEDSNMLLPIETEYNESENIVYTETDELGTYCIVDMQKMFVNLGYDDIVDRNLDISTADDVQTLLSEASEQETKISTPIDVVFMLQVEGSLSDVFQIQVDAIKKACEMLFSAYSDVRISIIAYTPMSLMYFLTTDIGSSDGTNQRYLTTYEEVDAALDTVEYTYSSDKTNRAYPIRFMLNVVDFRENATKFAFQIANGKANCGSSIPNNHYNYIINCRNNNINYSEVVPSGYKCSSTNEQIIISAAIESTGGIEIYSSNIAYMLIYNHISENTPEPQEYNIVLPTSWERITLIDKLSSENGVNSDTDTLTDWEETDTESGIITWDDDGNIQLPTVQECLEQYSDKEYVQNVLEKYVSTVPSEVWYLFLNEEILPIHSNPCNEDTDGDGILDHYDINRLYNDNLDTVYVNYINNGLIDMDSIVFTNDGFTLSTTPLSSILTKMGFEKIGEKYSNIEDNFDDWYIYSIGDDEKTYYSILKMRELTNEERIGVSIPFIELDMNLIEKAVEDSDNYTDKLETNIKSVTEGKVYIDEYSAEIAEYFADAHSEANYLIAETYIEKIIEEDCVEGIIEIPSVSTRIQEYLDSLNDIYDSQSNTLTISDLNNLTIKEKQSILAVRTANISFNSFAAEVVYHAVNTIESAKSAKLYYEIMNDPFSDENERLSASIGYSAELEIFERAVKADMGVGEESESGVLDSSYYDYDGEYVVEQRNIWGDF